ncbi:uncharacterized protein LOC129940219 [Eupeodes corollae]|uniref:uncharacterized protein LOC129940219 n=1 Tax=Eupeodes corollae TaxID=290404 RepID=UPI00249063E8|nr:uncharacterized protein LOC129940219 [Eupeodes corollae]
MSTTSPNRNKATTTPSTKITAEQVIIIIRLIKKYKCIWDRNHPDFGKRQIRSNAFKKIGSYFQLTAEDVSRKYRRYRNCYIQELKQIREKKKTFSNLFYFDEMDFLRKVVGQRAEAAKKSSVVSPSRESSDAINLDYHFNTDDDEIPIESLENDYYFEPVEEHSQFSSYESNHSNEEPLLVAENIKEEVAMSLEPEVVDQEECLIEEIQDEKELENATNDKSDEFDIFAAYLASQLREMDKISALETMEELQRIIFKRRIQILKRDQSSN